MIFSRFHASPIIRCEQKEEKVDFTNIFSIYSDFSEFIDTFKCIQPLTAHCPPDHTQLQEDWVQVYDIFKCACNGSEGNAFMPNIKRIPFNEVELYSINNSLKLMLKFREAGKIRSLGKLFRKHRSYLGNFLKRVYFLDFGPSRWKRPKFLDLGLPFRQKLATF